LIFCCILPFLGSRVLGFRSGFDFFWCLLYEVRFCLGGCLSVRAGSGSGSGSGPSSTHPPVHTTQEYRQTEPTRAHPTNKQTNRPVHHHTCRRSTTLFKAQSFLPRQPPPLKRVESKQGGWSVSLLPPTPSHRKAHHSSLIESKK